MVARHSPVVRVQAGSGVRLPLWTHVSVCPMQLAADGLKGRVFEVSLADLQQVNIDADLRFGRQSRYKDLD